MRLQVFGGFAGCILLFMAGIASAGPDRTREVFDEQTGATITVVDKPLVFAYSRPELAANLRDYVSLVAAAVNRSGTVKYWLVAYFWSTVDRRDDDSTKAPGGQLVVAADDRRIKLPDAKVSAHEAGIDKQVLAPPGFTGTPSVYAVDLPTLGFIAASRSLSLLLGDDDAAIRYELWEDRRSALAGFVRTLSGSP